MNKTGLSSEQLRGIPMLRGLSDAQLDAFSALFERLDVATGDLIFEAGKPARALYLLTEGEITLREADQETHRLHPPVIIGELGAATSRLRNSSAEAGEQTQLWQVEAERLIGFLEQQPQIGRHLLQNMLHNATEKIDIDRTRLADMRQNLIRTQKAMKRMRDFLLESQDTVVSKPLHEILEGLIQQNRRVNYRVSPPPTLAAAWRFDDQHQASVVQISRTHVSFLMADRAVPAAGERTSGVLSLSGPEIPVSGKVLRTIDRRVDIELDLLIDEYVAQLEGYLTRLQMLDLLV